jgi:hypothetical protein
MIFLKILKTTTILPTLELKYNKETTSSSTNTNTINNNIIIKPTNDNIIDCPIEIPPEISTNMSALLAQALPAIVKKSDTPQNISKFKEALISIHISYFKSNVVLLNNLIELFDMIITKLDDLRLLIALLLSIPKADVQVKVEEITMKGFCGTVCKKFRDTEKLKILLLKKKSFEVSYNQYYIQMVMEFNISLEYVLL